MRYIGLMLVGISIISYCGQPPHPKNRLSYSYDEALQASSTHAPASTRAASMSAFPYSVDLNSAVVQSLVSFCLTDREMAVEFINPVIVKHADEIKAENARKLEKKNATP